MNWLEIIHKNYYKRFNYWKNLKIDYELIIKVKKLKIWYKSKNWKLKN